MSASPFVSVAEVRQRVASVVEAISGFREVPWPLSPDSAPAGYDTYPFSVILSETSNTGRYRDNTGSGIRARSTVVVRFLAGVTPAEGEQLSSIDSATEAEASVIRALEARGPSWMHGLQVAYAGSSRGVAEDGAYLVVDVSMQVEHVLRLS